MIYRRDFLQHVGWGHQLISVGAFRMHVQLLFAKRSQHLRFSLYLNYGFQRTSEMKIANTGAVTVRLHPELKGRLAEAPVKLDLSENDIVRHALRAAVNAIEAND